MLPENEITANNVLKFAKGGSDKPSNYRPVNVTGVVGKYLKLFNGSAIYKLKKAELMGGCRYGFGQGRSCPIKINELLK